MIWIGSRRDSDPKSKGLYAPEILFYGGLNMTKGFTDEEKNRIRKLLLEKGKEFFAIYGFKKTGIRDLASAVGIANGTFYQFFGSKEELFFEIVKFEGTRIRNKIIEELLEYENNPKEALKIFYYRIVEELEHNPIMKKILLQDEMDFITSRLTPKQLEEQKDDTLVPLTAIMKKWQDKGLINETDPELIIGSIRSLVLLSFHKEQIGKDVYPEIIEFLLDKICSSIE